MDETFTIGETAVDRMLLLVPQEPETEILSRIADVARALHAEIFVLCPVVCSQMRAGRSDTARREVEHNQRVRRVDARRIAYSTAAFLEERDVGTQVEAHEFPTMAHCVLDAAERVAPDVLIVPKIAAKPDYGISHSVSWEQLWSKLGITTWIMHHGAVASDAIVGLIEVEPEFNDCGIENADVAAATTELAKALNVQAHLLCCDGKSGLLEKAEAAMALQITKVGDRADGSVVRELFDLASYFEVPNTRIHLDRGSEDDIIGRIVEPLGIGMVVAHARPRDAFGGLFTRHELPDIARSPCDLLVLGEHDLRH